MINFHYDAFANHNHSELAWTYFTKIKLVPRGVYIFRNFEDQNNIPKVDKLFKTATSPGDFE